MHRTLRKVALLLLAAAALALAILAGVQLREKAALRALTKAINENDLARFEQTVDKVSNLNAIYENAIFLAMTERGTATPLQAACRTGDLTMVRELLSRGAEVDFTMWIAPIPPLQCAVTSTSDENLQIAQLLLREGAQVDATGPSGADALSLLLENRKAPPHMTEMLALLCDYGADVHRETGQGDALSIACAWKNDEAILYLLDRETFDMNYVSPAGRTYLLDYCCGLSPEAPGSEAVIRSLIDRGVPLAATDASGKTAYDYALEANHESLTPLLLPAPETNK